MDLQAAQSMGGQRQTLTTLATLFCFALACAFLIGSLMLSGKLGHSGQPGSPLSSTFTIKTS